MLNIAFNQLIWNFIHNVYTVIKIYSGTNIVYKETWNCGFLSQISFFVLLKIYWIHGWKLSRNFDEE